MTHAVDDDRGDDLHPVAVEHAPAAAPTTDEQEATAERSDEPHRVWRSASRDAAPPSGRSPSRRRLDACGRRPPLGAAPALAAPSEPQQGDDGQHERRHRAVRAESTRSCSSAVRHDCTRPMTKPADQRDPQRPELADQRRGERRDDEEREARRCRVRPGASRSSPATPQMMPGAEPRHRFDAPHGHAEHRGDLAVVGQRPHRRAESWSSAQEEGRARGDEDREDDADDLRPAHAHAADLT